MARGFPLAGLLRLSHLREDAAAAELAGANARTSRLGARKNSVRRVLDETPSEVSNSAALAAVAAARSSSRSMLAELDAVVVQTRRERDAAQNEFDAARARTVRLEKLQTRHGERAAAEDLHAEQTVLDELAVTSWHRSRAADETETP
ncbi:MAG: flagellar FliJ family protein [Actinomycetales bacterium]|jgi:flagellar FliJ protein